VVAADAGEWKCIATNIVGNTTKTVTVTVNGQYLFNFCLIVSFK